MIEDDGTPEPDAFGMTPASDDDPEGFETGHIRRLLKARLFEVASAPTRVGRYTVLRRIGSGGMGVVYAAYDEDLDRRVAIKLVSRPPAEDPQAFAARARREAQALGRVAHPNVVAVHEVGEHVADDGTRFMFIAMEFVRGETLREWLAASPRGPRDIVEILVHAGRGLAAVHAAGLVHRDVKPENVMIEDAPPGVLGRVRLMDFGLARLEVEATSVSSDDWLVREGDDPMASPVITRTGALVGTPAYMAPEQQSGGVVAARADQFGWCVMAWEALFGERPFAGQTMAELFAHVGAGRRRDPRSTRGVPTRVRRVLERGLAVDPDARWPDMGALLAALAPGPRRGRWLATLAVGAGVVAVATMRNDDGPTCRADADAIVHSWTDADRDDMRERVLGSGLVYAADTWQRVEQGIDGWLARGGEVSLAACEAKGWSETLRTAHVVCMAERQRALTALVDVFATTAPEHTVALVERATQAVGGLPSPEPCADLEHLGARVAPPPIEIADDVDTLRRRASRVNALLAAGDYESAGAEVEAVVAEARASAYTPLRAEMLLLRTRVERALGRYGEAELTARTGYAEALSAGDDELAFKLAVQLVFVVGARLGRHTEGLEWAVHARAELTRSGTPPRLEFQLLGALGNLHELRGDYDEALDEHRSALVLQERLFPPEHPDLAHSINNIGLVEARQGEAASAIRDLEDALARYERSFGPQHPELADTLNNLGIVYEQAARYDDSLRVHLRALEIRERTFGPDHSEVAVSLNNLGTLYNRKGDFDAALAVYRRGLAIVEAQRGPQDRVAAELRNNIGWIHDVRGEYEQALAEYGKVMAIDEHNFGSGHPETAFTFTNVGIVYEHLRQYDRALESYGRALAVREAALGKDHVELADTLVGIGNVYKDMGRYDDALAQHERALSLITAARGADHVDNATPIGNRGNVRRMMKQYDRALVDLDRALALREPVLGKDHPRVAWLRQVRGETLVAKGDVAAGIVELEEALRVREAGNVPPADLADTRFVLAKALGSGGRARELVIAARDGVRGLPHRAELLAECEAWLRAHPG